MAICRARHIAMWPALPTPEYYDSLRLPLDHPMPLPGFAGYRPGIASLAPQATGPRRLSRVPRTTIRTFNAQYAGGFLSARSWNQNAFHGLRRLDNGSAPSWPHPKARESMTTLAQASLHVADRTIAHAPLRTQPLD